MQYRELDKAYTVMGHTGPVERHHQNPALAIPAGKQLRNITLGNTRIPFNVNENKTVCIWLSHCRPPCKNSVII